MVKGSFRIPEARLPYINTNGIHSCSVAINKLPSLHDYKVHTLYARHSTRLPPPFYSRSSHTPRPLLDITLRRPLFPCLCGPSLRYCPKFQTWQRNPRHPRLALWVACLCALDAKETLHGLARLLLLLLVHRRKNYTLHRLWDLRELVLHL